MVNSYHAIRHATEALCEPLAVEDYVIQSMPDASPVKWHLAHTSWFFETVILAGRPGYKPFEKDLAPGPDVAEPRRKRLDDERERDSAEKAQRRAGRGKR